MKEFIEKLNGSLEEVAIETLGISKGQFAMDKGEYSSYCSLSLYDVKEQANRLAEEYNNDFCEWEIVSDRDIHRECKPMCSEDRFIEITGYFDYEYCPYCGKKIKVVE